MAAPQQPSIKNTVPIIPSTIPAVANPCPLDGANPALMSLSSAAPSHQANGAKIPHKISPKIPNTNAQTALLLAGSPCIFSSPPNWSKVTGE